MKALVSVMLGAAVALAVVSPVAAQPGGEGRQRGPGGGPFPGRGGGGGEGFLLAMPEVQKELGITDDQKGLIEDMLADLRQGGGQRPDFGRLREMSEEERQKLFDEIRKQAEERQKQAEDAVRVILEDQQYARYEELRLQRQGVMALSRPDVAEKVGLSQEQQEKIAEIRDAARGEMGQFGQRGGPGQGRPRPDGEGRPRPEGEGRPRPEGEGRPRPDGEGRPRPEGEGRPDFQAMMAEMQKRREKAEADTLAVLTPEQKAKWEQMLGKKFEFPRPQFGGPGRGGPGGQPGEGRQRPPAE